MADTVQPIPLQPQALSSCKPWYWSQTDSVPRPEIGSEVGSSEVRMTWVSFMEPVFETSSGLVTSNSSHSFNLPEILFRLTIGNEVSWILDEMTNMFVSLFSFLKIQFVNLFHYENILFLSLSTWYSLLSQPGTFVDTFFLNTLPMRF